MVEENKRSIIKSTLEELSKAYYEYDGSNRITAFYSCVSSTIDNGPCLKTSYTYVGATANVQAFKEEHVTWDSSWDI